ncbi:SDR family NAD(P)-dependent oxidoreductase [Sphingomicrobium astaxanthinifaciens]|uniref:SDR family NAD(P)-dependent oxidoreductase n=1 Tax=Sphingomicrobium astaxanthinifaciens TaxID=1227949 RepID=UPI001FCC2A94|nr:SDR family oxidoreductase [Sphingomicrobium astaxanthinifaciens]MCJ7421504.1 SDR family oxidoreductase [Sphingomicrobium astaxanthinifaciens]
MHILITGASRGIGKAALDALRAEGHRVIGSSTSGGGDLLAADFTDPAAPRRLWEEAFAALDQRIDVLVNNAGVFEAVDDNASDADWHAAWGRTLQVNLQASADLCRLAIAHFRSRPEDAPGRIVNVASRAAYRGDSPRHWHYAAAKAGMVAMTKSIARGYAHEGILAFAVCPGFTMTGMAEDYLASRGGAQLLADIPLGKVAEPAEIGETIRWLATTAPASATGAILDVNGASFVR